MLDQIINSLYVLFAVVLFLMLATTLPERHIQIEIRTANGYSLGSMSDTKEIAKQGLAQVSIEAANCLFGSLLLAWRWVLTLYCHF
jgi:hypothetical protein